jgi:SM-20-related protein
MYTENDIKVIDNAFPEQMLKGVLAEVNRKGFSFGWASNKNKNLYHWNRMFAGRHLENRVDITNELNQDIASIWSLILYQYINDPNAYPVRAYSNGYTFGTEGAIHNDSTIETDKTCLIYINEEWNRDWAGETLFFNDYDIVKAVLPKWNRLVIFPSKMEHAARSVSKICPKLRTIFVFKSAVRNESSETN